MQQEFTHSSASPSRPSVTGLVTDLLAGSVDLPARPADANNPARGRPTSAGTCTPSGTVLRRQAVPLCVPRGRRGPDAAGRLALAGRKLVNDRNIVFAHGRDFTSPLALAAPPLADSIERMFVETSFPCASPALCAWVS